MSFTKKVGEFMDKARLGIKESEVFAEKGLYADGVFDPLHPDKTVADHMHNTTIHTPQTSLANAGLMLITNAAGVMEWAQQTPGADGTYIFPLSADTPNAPTGARVQDLIINVDTANHVVGNAVMRPGDMGSVTQLSPFFVSILGSIRGPAGASPSSIVNSFNGRNGDVILMESDLPDIDGGIF
jgi:hypothetical protein